MEEIDKYIPCPQHCGPPTDDYTGSQCFLCNGDGKILDPKYILCNSCGNSMCPERDDGSNWNKYLPHGLHNIVAMGSYSSYHLLDLNKYTFSLCEKCLREMFNKFKISPLVADHVGARWSYEEDNESYEYRLWRDSGGHHQAYINGFCNEKKDCQNKAIFTILNGDEFTENCCCEVHQENSKYNLSAKLVKFIPHTLRAFL